MILPYFVYHYTRKMISSILLSEIRNKATDSEGYMLTRFQVFWFVGALQINRESDRIHPVGIWKEDDD